MGILYRWLVRKTEYKAGMERTRLYSGSSLRHFCNDKHTPHIDKIKTGPNDMRLIAAYNRIELDFVYREGMGLNMYANFPI